VCHMCHFPFMGPILETAVHKKKPRYFLTPAAIGKIHFNILEVLIVKCHNCSLEVHEQKGCQFKEGGYIFPKKKF